MTDDWFSEYVYEAVVDKKHVPEDVLAVMEQEPIVLPAWDPMGALAKWTEAFCHLLLVNLWSTCDGILKGCSQAVVLMAWGASIPKWYAAGFLGRK